MTKRIVTTTSVFQPGYPAEDAMDRLKRIGFEGQDMALDYWREVSDSPFMAGDCAAINGLTESLRQWKVRM